MNILYLNKWNFELHIIKYPLRKTISVAIDFKSKYISVEIWNIQITIGYYNWKIFKNNI